jgi:hypothetical protein
LLAEADRAATAFQIPKPRTFLLFPSAPPPRFRSTPTREPKKPTNQPTSEPMEEKREKDLPAAAARSEATASGTPTASRDSSTPSSCSSNSNPTAASTPPTTMVPWAGDSCYYPGCRKDANCACEMCLASIDATRDLVRAPEAASARRFLAAKDRRSRPALFRGDEAEPPTRSVAKRARAAPARGRGEKGGGVSHDWPLYAATVLGFLILLWVDTGLVPEATARGRGLGLRRASRLAASTTSCASWSGGSGSLSAATGSPTAARTTLLGDSIRFATLEPSHSFLMGMGMCWRFTA